MQIILPDDAEIYYEKHGQGELIVLVHGSLGDYRDWANQVPFFLNSGYKVVTYSRRNHFPNPWKDYPVNYSLLSEKDDLLSLLKELGEPAYLIGYSYGGFVSALVARDYPSYVRKLILAEPPIFTMIKGEQEISLALIFQSEIIEPAKKLLRKNDLESGIRIFLDGISGTSGVFDRLKPAFRQAMIDNARTALPEIEITPVRDPFDCSDAGQIKAPTLLFLGEDSSKILQSITYKLAKCIPQNRLVKIPRSSHGMIWDNPKAFNESLLQFLRSK